MATSQDRTVWFSRDSLIMIALGIPVWGIGGLCWGGFMSLTNDGSLIGWLVLGILWGATMWFVFAIYLLFVLRELYEVGGQPLLAKGVQPPPPGRVEGWRGVPKAGPICCSPFPLGVPHQPSREPVSNPRHVERSRRFSRTPLSCSLHLKAYVAYPLGSAFGGRLTR